MMAQSLVPPRSGSTNKITIDSPVIKPSADSQIFYAVRHLDLRRIQRNVKNISIQPFPWSIIYSILFGVSITAGLTIIPLSNATGLADWVVPFYEILASGSLLCGGVFLAYDVFSRHSRKDEASDLDTDLEEILSCYEEERKSSQYIVLPTPNHQYREGGLHSQGMAFSRVVIIGGEYIGRAGRDRFSGSAAKIVKPGDSADEKEKGE